MVVRLKKVEGIVIRTIDYGESHKIITVFTKEVGKIGFMCRGAKKPRSRFAAIAQLFIYGTFLYHESPGLKTLNQADTIRTFRDLRHDFMTAAYAMYTVELLDRLTEENKPNRSLFELLYYTLHYFDEGLDPDVLLFIFEMKMLAVAGIKPELDRCVRCQSTDIPRFFSIKEAGFLCERCRDVDINALPISARTARLLRLFFYLDMERLGSISVKEATKREIKTVIDAYYDEYSGLHLRSKRFLEQLKKL